MACAIGPSVNPLQNKETQHVNIVLQCMYRFFEQRNMKWALEHIWATIIKGQIFGQMDCKSM